MASKNYNWCIGTTSFRTSQMNYKIELQLQLLKEFWSKYPDKKWDEIFECPEITYKKDEKYPLQILYYEFLKEKGFLTGDADIRDKDARVKTSGLVNIGLLDDNRNITEIGNNIEQLLDKKMNKDNIFMISEDSYKYLLQFLKMQIDDGNIKIKPFIALVYMIEKLEYLTYDEFTYLLPLCKNKYDVIKMVSNIKTNRAGFNVDEIIALKILDMNVYMQTLVDFSKEYPVTEETFERIGLNGKSKAYDRPFNAVYHDLVDLTFHLKNEKFQNRLDKYKELFDHCKKISGKANKFWKEYLFFGYKKNKIDKEFDKKFRLLEISQQRNIIDFKKIFFSKLHVFKWKANLKDYFDLNKRYFALTDIIKFEDDRIELDMLPKYYFKDIIDNLLDEELLSFKEYLKIMHSDIPIEEISSNYNINVKDIVNIINNELGENITIENINSYVNDERLKRFNELIDDKFKIDDLIKIFDLIKNRDDKVLNDLITDDATIPTIFEYIMGIAWYRISGKKGNILDYMNLSLDANLLPKTHAGGGMADIVYSYEKDSYPRHDLLIEATLSESTGQRKMELESVPRHLANNIIKTNNTNDYAIFVASELEESVILGMRGVRNTYYPKGNGDFIKNLKIIPIDIDIVKYMLKQNVSYNSIYDWFDKAFKSEIEDPKWFSEEILKNA